jgi:hypothetical protein
MREFVGKQEEQHTHMAATARSNDLIRAHLDGAPDGAQAPR